MPRRVLIALVAALAAAAPAAAHQVKLDEFHATVPSATWDWETGTWTVELAGMIRCSGGGTIFGSGVVTLTGPEDTMGLLINEAAPGSVVRDTQPELRPGVYRLAWGIAACGSWDEHDDPGDHTDELQDVSIRDIVLYDCAAAATARGWRSTLRPLIPISGTMPPDGVIECPPKPLDPCGAASPRGRWPAPLLPVKAGSLSARPCTPPAAPDAPAADVRCPPNSTANTVAVRSPLIPPPYDGRMKKSTKGACSGELEVREQPPPRPPAKPCARAAPSPLVPVPPCAAGEQQPAMGYATAAGTRLKRVRFTIRRGRTETIRLAVGRAVRERLRSTGNGVAFVLTFRDRSGDLHRARSEPLTLD